jgi:hypothetical protein
MAELEEGDTADFEPQPEHVQRVANNNADIQARNEKQKQKKHDYFTKVKHILTIGISTLEDASKKHHYVNNRFSGKRALTMRKKRETVLKPE